MPNPFDQSQQSAVAQSQQFVSNAPAIPRPQAIVDFQKNAELYTRWAEELHGLNVAIESMKRSIAEKSKAAAEVQARLEKLAATMINTLDPSLSSTEETVTVAIERESLKE